MNDNHRIAVGPLGAVCVAEIDGVVFAEARVSVAGTVISWGIPMFVSGVKA